MNEHRGVLHHLIIAVSDVSKSSPFYSGMFRYLGYELGGSQYGGEYEYEDWRKPGLGTPHEISIVTADPRLQDVPHRRGAVGHHHHLAFCALDRADVDRFHAEVLVPLAARRLCLIDDAPCACPEYAPGYYATFFQDPDGLKYEFVHTPD